MIPVTFTKHAAIRCIQRKIPEHWIRELMRNIPYEQGSHSMLAEGTKLVIAYADRFGERSIVTVFGIHKKSRQMYR